MKKGAKGTQPPAKAFKALKTVYNAFKTVERLFKWR
jgi:hypothetical protein